MDQQEQGNIERKLNSANLGLNLDLTSNQIKPGVVTYALNATVENFDGSSVNYQNEQGNDLCFVFPDGYSLIGEHYIQERNKNIFFLVNSSTGDSEIGYTDNNDCNYKTLVNAKCLNFNIGHPIHKVVHRITNESVEIYWTDGFNPRRYLDINNVPYKRGAKFNDSCGDGKITDELDCNAINVQPDFNIPQIDVVDVVSGGELQAGTYQFAAQYADSQGNPFTSYYSVTNPTPIADPSVTTVNFNYNVGKSIVININNLETQGKYKYFNLAVIKTINNITSVELIGTYDIVSSNKTITYTGQNVSNIRLSIQDIFEKFPYYEIAQDLTVAQDVLIWDQLTSVDRVNYQKIANKIKLQWETWRIPASENYADEFNATNLRGYMRDEIYPIEIVFLLKNGKQTDGFHIPGREKNVNENSQVDVNSSNPDFIENGTLAPYWKIYNTASLIDFSPEYTPNDEEYKGPYQYGEFAYWESTETYPCNEEVWGELAGRPIRHHKFPDVNVSPIFESASPELQNNKYIVKPNQSRAVFPIGVKIDIDEIQQLINFSDLSQEEKEEIIGFKIVRGDRSTNKSVIAKGMLRNVGKYTRKEEDFLYPNYPYNDVSEDPFLNSNNNAYIDLCKSYNLWIYEFNQTDDLGQKFLEIRYVDCNTNKSTTKRFYDIGVHKVCSMTKPVILTIGNEKVNIRVQTPQGPTVIEPLFPFLTMPSNSSPWEPGRPVPSGYRLSSIAFIEDGDYDVWYVTRDPGAGLRVCWLDTVDTRFGGELNVWIAGWAGSGSDNYLIHVQKGLEPTKCEGSGDIIKNLRREVREEVPCQEEHPLNPFIQEDLKHRQIFNSPDTSFGQPFLGDILKVENVMYGAGQAHFVEVKDNAKYKLLSKEAQIDALNSSAEIANITDPFNAGAMFAAYQAYLTIYINGITRKNYAYSYNSIASYDYTAPVDNSLGIKQRKLDIKKYLIPGVQAVGDDLPINNYNRETSVFFKTDEDVAPLPFPSETNSLISLGESLIEDRSRMTISSSNSCDTPEKLKDISVVAYYASTKNNIVNQWGQIYSYDKVDTGFQITFNDNTPSKATVFGGDVFISKFAYKTKLPFFIDNRVGAPDDSDIFYDEIGNVAYPKYWHSARSILSDYTVEGSTLTNFISYKANNFDCPNDPSAFSASSPGSDRTFYDGYFYLFAYGIPSFYCESVYNVDLRQAFNNKEGDFWPHVSTSIPDDWLQESFVPIAQDNTYYYNVTFSKQNKENFFSNLPTDWKEKRFTNYPFRAIYSEPQIVDEDNRVNNWLIYRALSYFDFPQNYGSLISLDGVQNKAVLARFENKSLMYNNLLTIDTSNPQAAYIGNQQLFRGAPPIDFAETDLGYVGSQNKMLLKIPQGQITADAKRGQIFLISGTQAMDITGFGSGVNRFMIDHLPFEMLRYFPNVKTDNHFNGIGLHGVFDSKYNRVIITKLDYIPIDEDVKYDGENDEFYIETIINGLAIRTRVYLSDRDYFCNKSWTLSFNLNTKSWTSFHSYVPNFYIDQNNFFYSGLNGCPDTFDIEGGFELFSGTIDKVPPTTTTTTTAPFVTTTTTTTVIDCEIQAEAFVVDCSLEGIAIDTSEPPMCTRPIGLEAYSFMTGYVENCEPEVIVYTSLLDACSAISYLSTVNLDNIQVNFITVTTSSLDVSSIVYFDAYSNDCTLVEDGFYFTEESAASGIVYEIVNGVIVAIHDCNNPTTTTTTTEFVPNLFCNTITVFGEGTLTYINELGEEITMYVNNEELTICAQFESVSFVSETGGSILIKNCDVPCSTIDDCTTTTTTLP